MYATDPTSTTTLLDDRVAPNPNHSLKCLIKTMYQTGEKANLSKPTVKMKPHHIFRTSDQDRQSENLSKPAVKMKSPCIFTTLYPSGEGENLSKPSVKMKTSIFTPSADLLSMYWSYYLDDIDHLKCILSVLNNSWRHLFQDIRRIWFSCHPLNLPLPLIRGDGTQIYVTYGFILPFMTDLLRGVTEFQEESLMNEIL